MPKHDARLLKIEKTLEANNLRIWQAYLDTVRGDEEHRNMSDAELVTLIDYLRRAEADPATVPTEQEMIAITKWNQAADASTAVQLAKAGSVNDWALGVCKRIRNQL